MLRFLIPTRLFILSLFSFYVSLAQALVLPNAQYQSEQSLQEYRHKLLTRHQGHRLFGDLPSEDKETHKLFLTPEEAISWAKVVSPRLSQSMAAKKFDVVPLSDPRYAILQAQIHDLWIGFVDLFPEQTQGLNEPPVIIVDTEVVNAFVPKYILEDEKIAHTVVVLTGILDAAGGADKRDHLSGIFAHEIAHSVFRHALIAYQERITRFYDAGNFRLGFKAPHNLELDAALGRWKDAAVAIGDLTQEQLLNLPSQGVSKPLLMNIWSQLNIETFDSSPSCWAARDTFDAWIGYQRFSDFTSSYTIRNADLAGLAFTSNQLTSELRSCMAQRKSPFLHLFSVVTGIPEEALSRMEEIKDMAHVFDSAADPISGFQALVGPLRAEMAEIERAYPNSKIGLFTHEEHADDIALIVHHHLGWNSKSLANFFRSFMAPKDLERCNSILATGALPPGGSFSDPHRATCYRVAHLEDLNVEISRRSSAREFAADYVRLTTEK